MIIIFFGIRITTPDITEDYALWEPLYYLANASVAEEIFSRILYIGFPLLAYDYFYKKQTKKVHKYIIGGGFEIENITIFLIVFSSILFGLAHYPSWGLWKVFPTFAAGIGFGYLFVKKGVHTAIVLHFLIDYMSIILLLFQNNLGLVFILALGLGIIMLFWLSSGAIYTLVYLKKVFYYIMARLVEPSTKPTYLTTGRDNLHYPPQYPNHQYPSAPGYPGYPAYPGYPGYPYYPYPPLQDHDHRSRRPPYAHKHELEEGKARDKPQLKTKSRIKRCPTCKNKLIYFSSTSRFYCEHCYKYV
jgi:hypothetical protein